MSAASPVPSQVRRNAAAAPSRSPQQASQQPAQALSRRPAPQMDFSAPRGDEAIHLNLSDIPHMRATVDVEVFSPSLLSRLLDLIMPLDKR